MRKMLPLLVVLFVWAAVPIAQADTAGVQIVKTEYQQRPFSWYYPYDYEYYTPHQTPYSSNGCYWVYTNGAYVYTCS
ncbi:MAG: hypothetical protein JSS62_00815 [Verrucomicrobia bacterium]|nr:hypothetical protein [Verrucomicrobiota bacterium]MBS0645946.1 hypothetical protein [Verrucomicrobiota bacterium]